MKRLLVTAAPDGSSLILGEDAADRRQPFRLVFQHECDGVLQPVRGHLCALWVTISGRRHIAFAGDTLDEGQVDRVLLEVAGRAQTCPVRSFPRNPRVWMSFPEPFEPGAVVRAVWVGGDRTFHEERTPPLQWGMRLPDYPEPPRPQWPDVPSPWDDPAGWTGYAGKETA